MDRQAVEAAGPLAGRVLPAAQWIEADWSGVLDCGALGPWALGPNAPGRGGDEPVLFYQRGDDQAGGQDA